MFCDFCIQKYRPDLESMCVCPDHPHVPCGNRNYHKTRPQAFLFFQNEIFEDDTNFLIFQIQQQQKMLLNVVRV